jgi:nicotinate-nucleotide adenylyltransferase
MKRIAFYGGSFDPVHNGHLMIGRKLSKIFELDEFWFIPAFHAPHKKDKKVTSPVCRYAMLALATNDDAKIKISTIELNAPEKPYTFETQTKLKNELPGTEIFFVMGADSWNEIDTWREWQKVLTLTNIIVVTRPDYEIEFSHVTTEIQERIFDSREKISNSKFQTSNLQVETRNLKLETKIYITDAVFLDVSATEIRQNIRENMNDWREDVPREVAKYIEKYELYI